MRTWMLLAGALAFGAPSLAAARSTSEPPTATTSEPPTGTTSEPPSGTTSGSTTVPPSAEPAPETNAPPATVPPSRTMRNYYGREGAAASSGGSVSDIDRGDQRGNPGYSPR